MPDSPSDDPYDLKRFRDAQAPVYGRVVRELGVARKQSHWMWFIFPQVIGLGSSPMAMRYAIRSVEEARAYLADTILGEHLRECTQLMLAADESNPTTILGTPDDMKFQSSMTLFDAVAEEPIFRHALDKFYRGQVDRKTVAFLRA